MSGLAWEADYWLQRAKVYYAFALQCRVEEFAREYEQDSWEALFLWAEAE